MYNGNDLMLQAGGEAIVVVIQYRLGVFGFLGGQSVHDRGTLNAGLCKYNLKWVELVIEFRHRRPAVRPSVDTASRKCLTIPSFLAFTNICIVRSASSVETPRR